MNPSMVRIELTDEQKLKLKPIFDAVTAAHNESTEKRNLRVAVHGQAFEADGGYAEFRLFDHEQAKIVKAAILDAIEIDKRKESQARLVQIKGQLASLTKERKGIIDDLKKAQAVGAATKQGSAKAARKPKK